MRFILPDDVKYIINKLHENGFSAFIAGGAVRDLIMGRIPHDYDISTSAKPTDVKHLFKRTVDTGIKHGTVTVIVNGVGYEVTTFRRESEYTDCRHPAAVEFVEDIHEDCLRRDFTINAMLYNGNDGLIDFFCGKRDINQKIIRCVGNPEKRFKEDALRMLRAIRFSAVLGFEIEEKTLTAIKKYGILIKRVSSERITEELNKIILSDNPDYFRVMYNVGLLQYVIPQLGKCFGEPQKNRYHIYDVGEHIMHTVKNIQSDLVLRWAALLHDVGKPRCASVDSNGIIHFYGHHRESVRIAEDVLHKLRLDNNTIKDVLILIENHDVRIEPSPENVKRMMSKTGAKLFKKLMQLQLADNKAKSDVCYKEKKKKIDAVIQIYEDIISANEPYRISDLVINGRDLIKIGYRPGRAMGDVLKILTDEVIINPSLNNRFYLLNRAKELK